MPFFSVSNHTYLSSLIRKAWVDHWAPLASHATLWSWAILTPACNTISPNQHTTRGSVLTLGYYHHNHSPKHHPTSPLINRHSHSTNFSVSFSTKPKPTMTSSSSPPYHNLTLYTAPTSNGIKPAILLEELGLKYDTRAIDIRPPKLEQKQPWFLELNPNGKIPALTDGDYRPEASAEGNNNTDVTGSIGSNGIRIFESAAIMIYLVDMYDPDKKFTYETGTKEYYEMLSWLMFHVGRVAPIQAQANFFRAMAPVYSRFSTQHYIDETRRCYAVLESRLSHADWLAGNKYTIADMATWPWVRAAKVFLDIDVVAEFPGLERWKQRIEGRPAIERARGNPACGVALDDGKLEGIVGNMKKRVDALEGTDKDLEGAGKEWT
ncbi:hypothetical protein HRR83_000955 [Exophiala dermatitidis]|nr:hypothetical protein HRR74_000959 [Exophiala dermatitidis]KAJ4528837.1 hypothetical protein HRR73_001460 [Exophiala dermatitidis]KAJ4608731.1 hypothetical protein HRR83_000955 [Exophiala dermatitidis]KAJ4635024.1 hypothetical protein HRR88_000955 [Exophiala dermatitidis]KAJ4648516.1 hypothetical protein HRR89_001688 [Exophiala dermatitidis]